MAAALLTSQQPLTLHICIEYLPKAERTGTGGSSSSATIALVPNVGDLIVSIRNQRVILDADLAKLYGVQTFRFNEAIKRNKNRFPDDFLFQLSKEESEALTSQSAMSKTGRGGRRTLPYAFTEHGALMAATILKSPKAVAMSVYIIRAFIRLREELASNSTLEKRLVSIEKTLLSHDAALRDVIAKIRPLLLPPPEPPRKRIGFHAKDV